MSTSANMSTPDSSARTLPCTSGAVFPNMSKSDSSPRTLPCASGAAFPNMSTSDSSACPSPCVAATASPNTSMRLSSKGASRTRPSSTPGSGKVSATVLPNMSTSDSSEDAWPSTSPRSGATTDVTIASDAISHKISSTSSLSLIAKDRLFASCSANVAAQITGPSAVSVADNTRPGLATAPAPVEPLPV